MRAATSFAARGLYVLTPEIADTPRLVSLVSAAIAGGAGAVQYRSKLAPPALRRAQASALSTLCADQDIPLIVNDDPALAVQVGAAGVHVGVHDAPFAIARSVVGRTRIVGVSCYADLAAAADAVANGADYIAFGSFFASPTKPQAVRAGVELIREAKARWDVPVVGIGGIDADNVGPLIDAGVDAVAVITAVFDAPDVEKAARRLAEAFPHRRDR